MSKHRHVIVAGYGPVGRVITDQLDAMGVRVTVIDQNPGTAEARQARGETAVLGDARDPAVLHEAGVEAADALVLAIPDENQAIEACRVARELHPGLYIAARTNYLSRGLLASAAGADHVIVEEVVTAEAMRRAVVERLAERDEVI